MLEELLQTTNARILLDGRRLYWDETDEVWVVLVHIYGKHKPTTLYEGKSLDEAITAVVGEAATED